MGLSDGDGSGGWRSGDAKGLGAILLGQRGEGSN